MKSRLNFKVAIKITACFLFLAFPLIANAGIVNNSGSSPEDSISIPIFILDTLGNRTGLDSTEANNTVDDWGWIETYYPDGTQAASDSFAISQRNTAKLRYTAAVFGQTATYTYRKQISDLDGAGLNGTYSYIVTVRDTSLKLGTVCAVGEFQLVGTAVDVSPSLAIRNAYGLGDTVRDVVGDTFNVVSGKVPVTFVDGLGDTIRDVIGDTFNVVGGFVYSDIKAVGSDAIVDNGDARLEVNVEEWKDVAPLALTTDGSVIAELDSTTTAGGANAVNATEFAAMSARSTWELSTTIGAAQAGSMGELLNTAANPAYPSASTIATVVWGNATRTLTSGAYGSMADSVWAKDTSNTLWNGLSRFGEYNALAQADCDGAGLVICTLDVRNASGGLGGVTVTINNASNVFQYQAVSNSNGFVYFNVDQSTTYRIVAGGLAGSVHDSLPYQTLTTTAATNKRDTIPMTTASIGSPVSGSHKRVYIYQRNGSAPVSGVRLHVELQGPKDSVGVPYDSTTGVCLAYGVEVVDTGMVTNINGYAHVDLNLNSNLKPNGTRWVIWAEHKGRMVWGPFEMNLTNTTSQCVQAIVSGGACP